MSTSLSINLNKIALLRNQREMPYPSVIDAARSVIAAGARGITVHPRPDERHIRHDDTRKLGLMLRYEYDGEVEYNIEGYPNEDWLALVREVGPDQATLVPDPPEAHTSDHGWDIEAHFDFLKDVIAQLKAEEIRVSLFVDADPEAVKKAKEVGADRVELFTGPYCFAFGRSDEDAELEKCRAAAKAAQEVGLGLNAGHDLNLENIPRLRGDMPWLKEVSIGHAFTSDALKLGYGGAVREYLAALSAA